MQKYRKVVDTLFERFDCNGGGRITGGYLDALLANTNGCVLPKRLRILKEELCK
jgi:hypothetical protein